MKQIDVGGMSFAKLREKDKYYVDKTLLIKDILESNSDGVYLFARPRRFGKTCNLSMLDAFFNMQFEGNTWFDGLAISDHPEFRRFKNAFPVVRLDLKGTKAPDFDRFQSALAGAVLDAFKKHPEIMDSPKLMTDERYLIDALNSGTASYEQVKTSAKKLTEILERIHGSKVVVLIDEYDRAVSDSYGEVHQKPILDLLGEFLNAVLKSNESLQMAYVTGIMQIAKASIFSDLNNVVVDDVLSVGANERFGFTADEVKGLLAYYGKPEKYREVKKWYDGYRFGKSEVYNPYSVMMYVTKDFQPGPYWMKTANESIIRRLLDSMNEDTYADVQDIVAGGSIETGLESALSYDDLAVRGESLYSLMAISGYLKAVRVKRDVFKVSIPNEEVKGIVDSLVKSVYPISDSAFNDFNRAVLEGDADTMVKVLQRVMLGASYMNLAENTYQAVMLTIMHGLSKMYDVRTECEQGSGRIDIILRSKSKTRPCLIFELKIADSEKKLDAEVDEAIRQIHKQRYYLGMPGKVILVGLAFWIKVPKGRIEIIDNGPDGTAMLGKYVR